MGVFSIVSIISYPSGMRIFVLQIVLTDPNECPLYNVDDYVPTDFSIDKVCFVIDRP